jgi:CHAT domain-containing protein
MGINPIQQLKNKPSSVPSKLLSQGQSPNKLLQEQNLEIKNTEELTKENYNFSELTFGIQLDKKLQNEIAILEVLFKDENIINIRCCHALFEPEEQLDIDITGVPEISFDKMMTNVKSQSNFEGKSREFIGAMREFSNQKSGKARRLTNWLRCLQKEIQEKIQRQLFYLIINDHTKYEIPWEMLEFDKNNYLGASLVTVRLQNIINEDDWNIEENNCCGKMVAYLNTRDLPDVQGERETIEKFKPILHEDINNFLRFLDSPQPDVSLIFIASHGFYGDNFQTIFGEADPKKQISLMGLSAYDFNCLSQSSSIVFMNSCHSGRLNQDCTLNIREPNPETGQYDPQGFAIFFLEKGAKGFIGTLYEVADKYAAKISYNFFAEYQQNSQLSVANILKNLREKAANRYKQNKDTENTLLFFYTFMYIYYGNPMTKLKLISEEDS